MSVSSAIEIVLLGRPRGKERPRASRDGHFYTPGETRDYEAALKYAAGEAMAGRAPLDGPLALDMQVMVPIPVSWPRKRQEAARSGAARPVSKPDFDNYAKVVDALNLIVWIDDGQVVDARVRKAYSDRPGMFIRVEPLGENDVAAERIREGTAGRVAGNDSNRTPASVFD